MQEGAADGQKGEGHLDSVEGTGLVGIDDEQDAGHFVNFLDCLGEV